MPYSSLWRGCSMDRLVVYGLTTSAEDKVEFGVHPYTHILSIALTTAVSSYVDPCEQIQSGHSHHMQL